MSAGRLGFCNTDKDLLIALSRGVWSPTVTQGWNMNDWQSTCLGRWSLPRDLSDLEIEAFFPFSEAERRVIKQRRSAVLKPARALQIA